MKTFRKLLLMNSKLLCRLMCICISVVMLLGAANSAVAAVIAVAASTMLAVYANAFAFARVDSRIAMIATRGIGLMTTPVASGMSCAVIDSISATVQAANPAIGETFGLHDIATHGVTEARL